MQSSDDIDSKRTSRFASVHFSPNFRLWSLPFEPVRVLPPAFGLFYRICLTLRRPQHNTPARISLSGGLRNVGYRHNNLLFPLMITITLLVSPTEKLMAKPPGLRLLSKEEYLALPESKQIKYHTILSELAYKIEKEQRRGRYALSTEQYEKLYALFFPPVAADLCVNNNFVKNVEGACNSQTWNFDVKALFEAEGCFKHSCDEGEQPCNVGISGINSNGEAFCSPNVSATCHQRSQAGGGMEKLRSILGACEARPTEQAPGVTCDCPKVLSSVRDSQNQLKAFCTEGGGNRRHFGACIEASTKVSQLTDDERTEAKKKRSRQREDTILGITEASNSVELKSECKTDSAKIKNQPAIGSCFACASSEGISESWVNLLASTPCNDKNIVGPAHYNLTLAKLGDIPSCQPGVYDKARPPSERIANWANGTNKSDLKDPDVKTKMEFYAHYGVSIKDAKELFCNLPSGSNQIAQKFKEFAEQRRRENQELIKAVNDTVKNADNKSVSRLTDECKSFIKQLQTSGETKINPEAALDDPTADKSLIKKRLECIAEMVMNKVRENNPGQDLDVGIGESRQLVNDILMAKTGGTPTLSRSQDFLKCLEQSAEKMNKSPLRCNIEKISSSKIPENGKTFAWLDGECVTLASHSNGQTKIRSSRDGKIKEIEASSLADIHNQQCEPLRGHRTPTKASPREGINDGHDI